MSTAQLLVLEMLAGGRIDTTDAEQLLRALPTTIGIRTRRDATERTYLDLLGSNPGAVIPVHC